MPDTESHGQHPESEPPVRDLLLADLDELIEGIHRAPDAAGAITDPLDPDPAAACRLAIGTGLGAEEIKLQAHARPL
jgi:hypothetical protein